MVTHKGGPLFFIAKDATGAVVQSGPIASMDEGWSLARGLIAREQSVNVEFWRYGDGVFHWTNALTLPIFFRGEKDVLSDSEREQQIALVKDETVVEQETTPEEVARFFHETYERLAPDYSYQTRKASAVPWEQVPENNKRLMIAVSAEVLKKFLVS